MYELFLGIELAAAALPVAVGLVHQVWLLPALVLVPFLLHHRHPLGVVLNTHTHTHTHTHTCCCDVVCGGSGGDGGGSGGDGGGGGGGGGDCVISMGLSVVVGVVGVILGAG